MNANQNATSCSNVIQEMIDNLTAELENLDIKTDQQKLHPSFHAPVQEQLYQSINFERLQEDYPPMMGPLKKLGKSSNVWKTRFFVLTDNSQLFVFKEGGNGRNPNPDSKPTSLLPVKSCTGFYDNLMRTWILQVAGQGIDVNGALQSKTWTLQCSTADELLLWLDAINTIITIQNEETFMRSLRSSESSASSPHSQVSFDECTAPRQRTIAPQERAVVELDPQYAAYTFPRRPSHASSNDSSRRPSTLNIPHPGNFHNISNSRRPSTSSPSSASTLSTSSMLPDDKLKTCPYLIGGKQNYVSQPLYNTTTRRRPSIVPSMASTSVISWDRKASVDSITSIPPVLLNTPMSPDTGVPPPSSPTSSVNQESHQFCTAAGAAADVMNRRTLSSIPNRQSSRPVGEGPGVFQGTSKEDYDTEILGAHDSGFTFENRPKSVDLKRSLSKRGLDKLGKLFKK